MSMKRLLVAGSTILVLLVIVSLAGFACGDDDDGGSDGSTATATDTAESDLDTARGFIDEMATAAAAGDVEGAETAFESAHDPLHEVIEALEDTDPNLAADLDEAIEHAEAAFEEGEETEHIEEEANEISEVLDQAAVALEG